MSKVLYFGKKVHPKVIVVMCHGFCDTAESNRKEAAYWAEGLKDVGALVVVPQAPQMSHDSTPKCPGYNWIPHKSQHDYKDDAAALQAARRETKAAVCNFDRWLDRLLEKHNLDSRHLILGGFSQGSILAAIAGIRRRARGIVLMGGPTGYKRWRERAVLGIPGWEKLLHLPASSQSRSPKFCVINGTKDPWVVRHRTLAMLKGFDTFWHWDKGAGHDFKRSWYKVSLRWMGELLAHA